VIWWDQTGAHDKPAHWRERTEWSDGVVEESQTWCFWAGGASPNDIQEAVRKLVWYNRQPVSKCDITVEGACGTWEEPSNDASC